MRSVEWLNSLTVGSEVAEGRDYRALRINRVTRITPTQIVVGLNRYRKRDGRAVGDGGYWSASLYEPTPEVREHAARRQALNYLQACRWDNMTTASLVALADAAKVAERKTS